MNIFHKLLEFFGPDTKVGRTDGQTDGRMDGQTDGQTYGQEKGNT